MLHRTRSHARRPKITQLTFSRRGGARRGAGRKPKGVAPLVPHAKRTAFDDRTPVLVTAKLERGLPNLRRGAARQLAWRALGDAKARFGVRLIHFSLQSNHLHAIVEARDAHALGRAMKGLCVRIARALNRVARRHGRVFADRYHARPLRTPREVRNALAYTLLNARKHGARFEGIDPCSSAAAFDGWREHAALAFTSLVAPPVSVARSWLLRVGWRRHGLIRIEHVPGPAPPGTRSARAPRTSLSHNRSPHCAHLRADPPLRKRSAPLFSSNSTQGANPAASAGLAP